MTTGSSRERQPAGLRLRAGAGLCLFLLFILVSQIARQIEFPPDAADSGDRVVQQRPGDEALHRLLLEAAAPDALEAARRHLQDGLAHRRGGRHDEAAAAFERAARENGLRDWSTVLAADLVARQGDTTTVGLLVARLPEDLLALRGRSILSAARLAAGDPDGAWREARAALSVAPAARDSGDALKAMAAAEIARGDTAAARRNVLALLPLGSPSAVTWAASVLPGLGPLEPTARLVLMRRTLADGEIGAAAAEVDRLARSPGVDPALVDSARMILADALYARRRYDEATALYSGVARDGAARAMAGAALVGAGRGRLRQARTDEARRLLERAGALTESDPAAAQEALYILADLDHDAGATDVARARFRKAAELDPRSEWGGEAAVRLGLLAYQAGDFLTAASSFEAFRTAHTTGWRHQQGSYLAALSYRRLGERELSAGHLQAARQEEPTNYYALRAAELTGAGALLGGLLEDPSPDPNVASLATGAVARAAVLRSLGLLEAADTEETRTRRALARQPGGLEHLGEHLMDRGRTVEAVRIGREARRVAGGWTPRSLALVYPLPFRTELESAALRWNVDPFLLAGLVRQESLFQPDAVSVAGAVGLTQILPVTARSIAPGKAAGTHDLRDPQRNLEAGAAYLAHLLDRSGARLDYALVAYNAGSGRLARWQGFPEHSDPDLFLERIPFRETREYVRTVLENARIYEALYGPAFGPLWEGEGEADRTGGAVGAMSR